MHSPRARLSQDSNRVPGNFATVEANSGGIHLSLARPPFKSAVSAFKSLKSWRAQAALLRMLKIHFTLPLPGLGGQGLQTGGRSQSKTSRVEALFVALLPNGGNLRSFRRSDQVPRARNAVRAFWLERNLLIFGDSLVSAQSQLNCGTQQTFGNGTCPRSFSLCKMSYKSQQFCGLLWNPLESALLPKSLPETTRWMPRR